MLAIDASPLCIGGTREVGSVSKHLDVIVAILPYCFVVVVLCFLGLSIGLCGWLSIVCRRPQIACSVPCPIGNGEPVPGMR